MDNPEPTDATAEVVDAEPDEEVRGQSQRIAALQDSLWFFCCCYCCLAGRFAHCLWAVYLSMSGLENCTCSSEATRWERKKVWSRLHRLGLAVIAEQRVWDDIEKCDCVRWDSATVSSAKFLSGRLRWHSCMQCYHLEWWQERGNSKLLFLDLLFSANSSLAHCSIRLNTSVGHRLWRCYSDSPAAVSGENGVS